jgi:hypothetical protein
MNAGQRGLRRGCKYGSWLLAFGCLGFRQTQIQEGW